MRQPVVSVHTVTAVLLVAVSSLGGILAPGQAAAQTQRQEPRECKDLGPASPRCIAAKDKQMKEGLTPRACTKYGAESPQCERAMKRAKPKAKAGTATP